MSVLTSRSHAYHFGVGRLADHFVYRCYDADGLLLYIGCTSNVARRVAAHRRASGGSKASRWLRVTMTRYEIEGPFRGRDAGRDAERDAIQAERPLFNYQQQNAVGFAAWMTRRPIALYLIERGHIELAVETVCACWRETREAGAFDDFCAAHVAARVAGLTDLPMYDDDDRGEAAS